MRVNTVNGEIHPDELGITLPHEHLLVDLACRWRRPAEDYLASIAEEPVRMEILGDLRRNPMISKDSLRLTEPQLAVEELEAYRELGGRSLVDQTAKAIGRDPAA